MIEGLQARWDRAIEIVSALGLGNKHNASVNVSSWDTRISLHSPSDDLVRLIVARFGRGVYRVGDGYDCVTFSTADSVHVTAFTLSPEGYEIASLPEPVAP